MAIAKSVAGVCVARDVVDLIPFICGHYLRVGFGHITFIDDGSSDGTFEFLRQLAQRTNRISVRQIICQVDQQPSHMTEAANELIRNGHSIIVPFDADEIWNVQGSQLETIYADMPEVAFSGRWVNFVQQRSCSFPRPFGLLRMKYRAPSLRNANMATVTQFSEAFVCYHETKAACKTRGEIALSRGQHTLVNGPKQIDGQPMEIFHLPLRYRSEILKRGLNYEPRRTAIQQRPGTSWQSTFHRKVVLDGSVDDEWAANSANAEGCLDLKGGPIPLEHDDRLRALLLRAAAYLYARYRMIAC
jgi:hypothetical protein